MIALEKGASRSVTKKEYEKLAAFRYNLRQFLRFSEMATRSVGLTSQQHQALLTIKGFPDGTSIYHRTTRGTAASCPPHCGRAGRSVDAPDSCLPRNWYIG
jgi:hypothetical protein